MDGIHDLGGKQGFGQIPIDDNIVFHHDWERRMWAISRNTIAPGMTIDWFRHGVERMTPADYLTFAYFTKWCTNFLMLMVDDDVITLDEAIKGKVEKNSPVCPVQNLAEVLELQRGKAVDFSRATTTKPRFEIGQEVTTKRHISSPHTRLPGYARNSVGTVISHHGCHLLADKGALGRHEGEHLYTVSFTARELWGADANPLDTVTLELWESYFV